MPARKKKTSTQVGAGMSAKQMQRKKPFNADMMIDIDPLTDNQSKVFDAYKEGKNVYAYGAAGTGKTFIMLYLALKEVLNPLTPYNRVVIVRSLVSTRRLDSYLVTTKISHLCIRFHTRTWSNTCSSCLQTMTLTCCGVI